MIFYKKHRVLFPSNPYGSQMLTGRTKLTSMVCFSCNVSDLYETRKAVNVVLPTAPKASRDYEDISDKVPKEPPFCAYISNLPYDVDEEEITEFFKDMRIASLRIPKDDRGGEVPRSKGYGYVEFEDRESLMDALILRDTNLKNRRVRIEVATNNDGERRRGMGMMSRDREGGGAFSSGDWRSGARAESSDERRSFRDRDDRGGGREGGGGGGAFTREGMREGGIGGERSGRDSYRSNREDRGGGGPQDDGPGAWRTGDRPSFNRDRDRGGFSRDGDRDRDRGFTRDGDRDRGFNRDGDREERRGFGGRRFEDRDRNEGFTRGGGRDRDDRDRSEGFSRGGRDNRDDRDDRDGSDRERDQPRARPKLVLAPRTKPIEPAVAEPAAPAQSIFGSAKPVDTSQREREIEEKLAKHQTTDRPSRDRDGSRDRRPISRERRRGGSRDRRQDSRQGSRAGSRDRRNDSRDRRADSRDRRGDSDDDRRPSSSEGRNRGSPDRRPPSVSPDRRPRAGRTVPPTEDLPAGRTETALRIGGRLVGRADTTAGRDVLAEEVLSSQKQAISRQGQTLAQQGQTVAKQRV
ncbi:unnamed protein product [Callosobruchus maculatus]|uniref:RRM domain-containing protein n=1 Tax=Callosobruchus maculatus TaxID=64391 RepID=A0A653CFA6_CALMS|nr:unnamed protein product [Callosobruchus maculatus]